MRPGLYDGRDGSCIGYVIERIGCEDHQVGGLPCRDRPLTIGRAERFRGGASCPDEDFVVAQAAIPQDLELSVQAEARRHPERAVRAGQHATSRLVELTHQGLLRFKPKLGAHAVAVGNRLASKDFVRFLEQQIEIRQEGWGP